MEIFGGFMVMMSILSFFLVVVWLVMPFVVFTIKGKLDRTLDVLTGIEVRLTAMEARLVARDAPSTVQTPATGPKPSESPREDEESPPQTLPLA